MKYFAVHVCLACATLEGSLLFKFEPKRFTEVTRLILSHDFSVLYKQHKIQEKARAWSNKPVSCDFRMKPVMQDFTTLTRRSSTFCHFVWVHVPNQRI